MELTQSAKSLWAKKANDGSLKWLPLYVHLADTAAVARLIWRRWLSEGVRELITSELSVADETDAERLFIFCAAAHDIGKAIPAFQNKQSYPLGKDLDDRLCERMRIAGVLLGEIGDLRRASKTHHSTASQRILEIEHCNKSTAAIIGAHHGKPVDISMSNQLRRDRSGTIQGSYYDNYYVNRQHMPYWHKIHLEFIDYALCIAGYVNIAEIPVPNLVTQVLLSGLLIMADWIASNEDHFSYISINEDVCIVDSSTRARQAWKQIDLPQPWSPTHAWRSENLYKRRFNFEQANQIQKQVTDIIYNADGSGVYILEAPMGIGKTEAALVAAEMLAQKSGRKGIFFALPTQATTNGIFPRILDWVNSLEKNSASSIILAHGKAQFLDLYQSLKLFGTASNVDSDCEIGTCVHPWFEGQKKTLLSDFVVGTIDQLLMMALQQKHAMLRHLGLAEKVVIIDECHAYDAYMNQYLEMALRWLGAYRVPVIMLSATLPLDRRIMLINAYLNKSSVRSPMRVASSLVSENNQMMTSNEMNISEASWATDQSYPVLTWANKSTVKSNHLLYKGPTTEVDIHYANENSIIQILKEALSEGGCAGIIVNTVKRAQQIAGSLCNIYSVEYVQLIHSRFTAPDRASKEQILLKSLGKPNDCTAVRPKLLIVVGTQVLEQSLDIDFDIIITDICPMDLLLQRIGRLHRHRRTRPVKLEKATCIVLCDDPRSVPEESAAVYGEYLLYRTRMFLPEKITLPADISSLVQLAYDNRDPDVVPDRYDTAKTEFMAAIRNQELEAKKFRISSPSFADDVTLADWLRPLVSDTDRGAEASVRDTDPSIEVLLIQEKEGFLYLLPGQAYDQPIPANQKPDDRVAKLLARQIVRLPPALCYDRVLNRVIKILEERNMARIPHWQESVWLNGELFLILDNALKTELCGYIIKYDQFFGLMIEVEDDQHASGVQSAT